MAGRTDEPLRRRPEPRLGVGDAARDARPPRGARARSRRRSTSTSTRWAPSRATSSRRPPSPSTRASPRRRGSGSRPSARRTPRPSTRAAGAVFNREVFDLFYPAYGDSWPTFRGMVGMTLRGGRQGRARLPAAGRRRRHAEGAGAQALDGPPRDAPCTAAAGRRRASSRTTSASSGPALEEGRRVFVVPAGQDRSAPRLPRLPPRPPGRRGEGRRPGRSRTSRRKGETLPAGSLVVDTAQPHGRFAEVVLESQAALAPRFLEEERRRLLVEEDERFFDVTAWSLPIAFGLTARALPGGGPARGRIWPPGRPEEAPSAAGGRYGWLLPGDDAASRRAAATLAGSGVRVSVTTKAARERRRRPSPPDRSS